MIDLHCHMLSSIDDDAKTMDDSLAMDRAAVAEGITHLLSTSHYKNGRWNKEKTSVLQGISIIKKELDNCDIFLSLFPRKED